MPEELSRTCDFCLIPLLAVWTRIGKKETRLFEAYVLEVYVLDCDFASCAKVSFCSCCCTIRVVHFPLSRYLQPYINYPTFKFSFRVVWFKIYSLCFTLHPSNIFDYEGMGRPRGFALGV